MVISGGSMVPFLVHGRDSVCFRKPDRRLKTGDIVFYQRANGQFVMHRIRRVRPDGYEIVGDAQTQIEAPITEEQIFGLVHRVKRKGTWIGPEHFWWKFFARVWIRIVPLRPGILRLYNILHRVRSKQ